MFYLDHEEVIYDGISDENDIGLREGAGQGGLWEGGGRDGCEGYVKGQ